MPVPVNGIANAAAVMLFKTLTAPVLAPPTVGVNVTFIAQLALTPSGFEETQLSVSEKSPVAFTAEIVRLAFWVTLVSVSV